MDEVLVTYRDGVQFEAAARGHRIICDQPAQNGGKDAGMTPPELMLASLGTCAGYYAAQYLSFKKQPLDGLSIKITADKAANPPRLGGFLIEVNAPAVDASHQDALLRSVKKCLIHHTLMHPPEIETRVATAQPAHV
jgi:putative redox protein